MFYAFFTKIFRIILAFCFILNIFIPPAFGQMIISSNLPNSGTMLTPTTAFQPTLIKGINIHPEDPLTFDFLIDEGDSSYPQSSGVDHRKYPKSFQEESKKLIKYFLASLTTPGKNMWVNLSPYEKNRMIPESFGQTEMGRDLLAQDYVLKQLMSSLMYPENDLGKTFWERVYSKTFKKYGTTDIPLNTFNKVWIIASNAKIYEHEKGAFVIDSHLKVMLEEDYMALNKTTSPSASTNQKEKTTSVHQSFNTEIIREILIPEIEREVNQGETFANLRQIYNSMILATWYKKALKESLLGKIYADKNKLAGVTYNDPSLKEKIYNQYIESFKQGVFDLIKDEYDPATKEIIPRRYFSGGVVAKNILTPQSKVPASDPRLDAAMTENLQKITTSLKEINTSDLAMTTDKTDEIIKNLQKILSTPISERPKDAPGTVQEKGPWAKYFSPLAQWSHVFPNKKSSVPPKELQTDFTLEEKEALNIIHLSKIAYRLKKTFGHTADGRVPLHHKKQEALASLLELFTEASIKITENNPHDELSQKTMSAAIEVHPLIFSALHNNDINKGRLMDLLDEIISLGQMNILLDSHSQNQWAQLKAFLSDQQGYVVTDNPNTAYDLIILTTDSLDNQNLREALTAYSKNYPNISFLLLSEQFFSEEAEQDIKKDYPNLFKILNYRINKRVFLNIVSSLAEDQAAKRIANDNIMTKQEAEKIVSAIIPADRRIIKSFKKHSGEDKNLLVKSLLTMGDAYKLINARTKKEENLKDLNNFNLHLVSFVEVMTQSFLSNSIYYIVYKDSAMMTEKKEEFSLENAEILAKEAKKLGFNNVALTLTAKTAKTPLILSGIKQNPNTKKYFLQYSETPLFPFNGEIAFKSKKRIIGKFIKTNGNVMNIKSQKATAGNLYDNMPFVDSINKKSNADQRTQKISPLIDIKDSPRTITSNDFDTIGDLFMKNTSFHIRPFISLEKGVLFLSSETSEDILTLSKETSKNKKRSILQGQLQNLKKILEKKYPGYRMTFSLKEKTDSIVVRGGTSWYGKIQLTPADTAGIPSPSNRKIFDDIDVLIIKSFPSKESQKELRKIFWESVFRRAFINYITKKFIKENQRPRINDALEKLVEGKNATVTEITSFLGIDEFIINESLLFNLKISLFQSNLLAYTDEDTTKRILRLFTNARNKASWSIQKMERFRKNSSINRYKTRWNIFPEYQIFYSFDKNRNYNVVSVTVSKNHPTLDKKKVVKGSISARAFHNIMATLNKADYYFENNLFIETIQSLMTALSSKKHPPSVPATKDSALLGQKSAIIPGGIDLNPKNLHMEILRDGKGIALPVDLQDTKNIHIDGFMPVIINIQPVGNLQILLGLGNTDGHGSKPPDKDELSKRG